MSALTAQKKKMARGKLIYIRTYLGSHLSMSDLVSGQSKNQIFIVKGHLLSHQDSEATVMSE